MNIDTNPSESDIEIDDKPLNSDRSNVTTDDELFEELMAVPAVFQDCLIPENCPDEVQAMEHLTQCLDRRFKSYPVVFMGKLQDALKEAFSPKQISERSPLFIYVNNDKNVYTNLFCKQLLCHDQIVEYLMSNCLVWAWDVTFASNAKRLNEIFRDAFVACKNGKQFDFDNVDQCPLLIGISRDEHGNYVFNRLIEGSTKKPTLNDFLGSLMEFKEQFHLHETNLEKSKEQAKRDAFLNLFELPDIKSLRHSTFQRSKSMFPHSNEEFRHRRDPRMTYARLMSTDPRIQAVLEEYLSHPDQIDPREILEFQRVHLDPEDADDEDDAADDNEKTPMPENAIQPFP